MEFIQNNITGVVSLLTLLSNIVFVVTMLAFFGHKPFQSWARDFINKNVLNLLLGISLSAVLGSLAYSNILNFPPCDLCWIQRIFIFPQPILLIMARWKSDINMVLYLFPLSIIGGVVALYQSLAGWGIGSSLLDCTAQGGACSKLYIMEYGYITIPLMSLSIFVYMITISIIYFKSRKNVG